MKMPQLNELIGALLKVHFERVCYLRAGFNICLYIVSGELVLQGTGHCLTFRIHLKFFVNLFDV